MKEKNQVVRNLLNEEQSRRIFRMKEAYARNVSRGSKARIQNSQESVGSQANFTVKAAPKAITQSSQ